MTADEPRRGLRPTADTSAVVAALAAWHEQHEAAAEAIDEVSALPAHVVLEAYSVLTRLPSGLAVPAPAAAEALARRFAAAPLRLSAPARRSVLATLASAGVVGGATYDGLVALEASTNDHALITLDRRAIVTYQRLGVPFQAIGV